MTQESSCRGRGHNLSSMPNGFTKVLASSQNMRMVWANLNLAKGDDVEKNLEKFSFFIWLRDIDTTIIKCEKREIHLGIIIIYIHSAN